MNTSHNQAVAIHGAPGGNTLQTFHPTTGEQEARALVATCFHAIAAGWPISYAKASAIQAAGPARLDLDTDAMIRDAADLAARITQAAAVRMDPDQPGQIIQTGPPLMGE